MAAFSSKLAATRNSPDPSEPEEEARMMAEIEALAAQEERVAALARERAERRAMAEAEANAEARERERAQAKTAARRKRAKKQADAAEEFRLHALAKVVAKEQARVAGEAARTELAKLLGESEVPAATPADAGPAMASAASGPGRRLGRILFSGRKVWYCTSEGERLGPFGFRELRARAAGALLDPRLDLVWKRGAASWLPAGEVDGLFETRGRPAGKAQARAVSRPEALTAPARPKTAATRDRHAFHPGVRRQGFLVAALLFPPVWFIGMDFVGPLLIARSGALPADRILSFAPLVPLLVAARFAFGRLANLGMSGWWFAALFVPGLNLWLAYRCFACPPGYALHRKIDASGVVLAVCYWLAAAYAITHLAGMAGSVADPSAWLSRAPRILAD